MSTVRRIATVIGLALTVIVGASIPASATYSESLKLTTAVVTPSVDAPGSPKVTITCDNYNLYATITWNRSASARVSGYLVTAQFGSDTIALQAGPTASRTDYSVGRLWAAYQVPVTLTTLTEYGWSKAATPVMVTTC